METSVEVNETETTKSNNNPKLDKGAYTLEYEGFSRGVGKGFGFWKKAYKSTEDATTHLMELKKCSKEEADAIVVGLLNQQINNTMRGRATSKLPNDDDAEVRKTTIAARIASGQTTLVSEADAESYVPGTREKTSIPGLWKEYNTLRADAIKAKNAGNLEEAEDLRSEAKETFARIKELMSAEDDLDSL